MNASRLALGTVQFGLPYGIANQSGQAAPADVSKIIAVAKDCGIDTLDTAVAYGSSEEVLGAVGIIGWRTISKLPPLPESVSNATEWVKETLGQSLRRLRIDRLNGLLLHRSADLFTAQGMELYNALLDAKNRGYIERFGVSVYEPEELDQVIQKFELDIVQLPFNVVDRRFESSGWFRQLSEAGIDIHTRSVFLQGLLLMTEEERPKYFSKWQPLWLAWKAWLSTTGISALSACLSFVLSRSEIQRVVVGVDNVRHLCEIVDSTNTSSRLPPLEVVSVDPDLVNPSRWLRT